MRKAERELRERSDLVAIMQEALVCRIGLSDSGTPYVVPMNFGLGENCLYLHCAAEGRKLDIIRRNNRVCFEMDLLREVKRSEAACGWSARYESVIGSGRAVVVDDAAEKRRGIDSIMNHYGAPGPHVYPDGSLAKTTVIRIDIESMTGKRRP